MRKGILVAIVVLIAGYFGAEWAVRHYVTPAVAEQSVANPEHVRVAEIFLDHLDAKRYTEAFQMTTAEMQAQLPDTKLKEIWDALPVQLGARASRSALRGESVKGIPIVTSTLVFERGPFDARIVVNGAGQIEGFRIVPVRAEQ